VQFVVIGRDKPDPSLRLAARADHLDFIATRQDQVIYGGPLIENGNMVGSLFIFEVPDRAGLEAFFKEDPYFTREIFASIEIFETRWLVPEKVPGALKAEAAQARAGGSGGDHRTNPRHRRCADLDLSGCDPGGMGADRPSPRHAGDRHRPVFADRNPWGNPGARLACFARRPIRIPARHPVVRSCR
jgi:uncharacterized protein